MKEENISYFSLTKEWEKETYMNTTTKRLGAGLLTALTLSSTVAGTANAADVWQQEYKNDVPGVATPIPDYLAGGLTDINANTGIAFANVSMGNGLAWDYGSLGSFWNNEGDTTLWCIDYGTAFYGVGGDPTNVENTENAAITNYIITKYEGDRTPQNHAAIAYAVHMLNDPMTFGYNSVDGNYKTASDFFNNLINSELSSIAQRGNEMIEEARANMGPYTLETTINEDLSVTTVLRSAAGNEISGFNAVYTLEGAGVFDVNGDGVANDGDSNTVTAKTGEAVPNIVRSVDEGGTVDLRVTVDNLPGDSIRVWDGGGLSQTMMAKGGASASVEATDSADVQPATPEPNPPTEEEEPPAPNPDVFTPEVTTKTSHNWATPGTEIKDNISVTGNKDGQELTVTSTLWFSETKPELSDTVPADAVEVGSVETKVTGNGEFVTPGITVDKVGYYVWTESIPETPINGAPEGSHTKAWQGKYGVSTEITPVGDVTTKASPDTVVGNEIYDTAIVTGEIPEGAYLKFDLYRISDEVLTDEEVEAGDFTSQFTEENKVWSSTKETPVDGAGEYKSETFTPAKDGTYSYVETLYDKDGNVLKQGKKGAGSESVVIFGKVTTKASEDVVLGKAIHDTAVVDGVTPEGAYLTFDLYKISDEVVTDEEVDAGDFSDQFTDENKVWSSTDKVAVDGAGEYKSAEFTPSESGTYSYVETLRDKDGNIISQGKKGVGSESVIVFGTVTTKASEDVYVGEDVFDTATVEGAIPEGAYLGFDLYKISDEALTDEEVEAGDFTAQFTDANKVWSSTEKVAVNGAGDYESERFTTTEAGTYSYVETLYDKDGNVISQGKKGVGSESVIVKEKPETPTPEPTKPQSTPEPSTPAPSTPTKVVTQGTANTGGDIDAGNNALIGGALASLLAGAGAFFARRKKN